MRRSTTMLALAALFAIPAVASAQATDIAVTRQQIQADRQAIVAENLPLTEAQATAFWPLYQAYRAEVVKLGDQRVAAIMAPTAGDTATDKETRDHAHQVGQGRRGLRQAAGGVDHLKGKTVKLTCVKMEDGGPQDLRVTALQRLSK